jgi:TRAP-type C4-dicarboxylate transport system permease small subunit
VLARLVTALARGLALLGGMVLLALIGLTALSVIGRWLNGALQAGPLADSAPSEALLALGIGPITGDFELIEAGMAFVIFAFLPLAQLTGAHADVALLTRRLGPRGEARLAALWAVLFAGVLILVARQLWLGTLDKRAFGETTFLLALPLWWAYAAALVGAMAAALTALYVATARIAEAATGASILRPDP